ncbi:MAG: hypothetical protein ACKV2Q_20975, partial [Planctomycetaceae bacterium]
AAGNFRLYRRLAPCRSHWYPTRMAESLNLAIIRGMLMTQGVLDKEKKGSLSWRNADAKQKSIAYFM